MKYPRSFWYAHKLVASHTTAVNIAALAFLLVLAWEITTFVYLFVNSTWLSTVSLTHPPTVDAILSRDLRISQGSAGHVYFSFSNAKGQELFGAVIAFRRDRAIDLRILSFGTAAAEEDRRPKHPLLNLFRTTWFAFPFFATRDVRVGADYRLLPVVFDERVRTAIAAGFEAPEPESLESAKRAWRILLEEQLDIPSLEARATSSRIWNGKIQFLTVVSGVSLMLIGICRFWIFVLTEERTRRESAALKEIERSKRNFRLAREDPARVAGPSPLNAAVVDACHRRVVDEIAEWKRITLLRVSRREISWWTPGCLHLAAHALEWLKDGVPSEGIPELVWNDCEVWESWSISGMLPARFFLWAMPTIGFIGTIVGISGAMGHTGGVGSPDPVDRGLARSFVTGEIGVAFDTTYVALVLTLIGTLLTNLLEKGEAEARTRARDDIVYSTTSTTVDAG